MRRYERLTDERLLVLAQEQDEYVAQNLPKLQRLDREIKKAQTKASNARKELEARRKKE